MGAMAGAAETTSGRFVDVNGRMREANGRFVEMGGAADTAGKRASRALSGASTSGGMFGGTLGRITGQVAGIAAAFAAYKLGKALFVDPITMAGQFQQTLNVLGSVSNATSGQLAQMSKLSIKLGADIHLPATSAKDAANAMLELSKGGLSVADTMKSVHAVLLLSTAAQIDNATAANAVTQALGAFQLPASQAAKIVDDFAGAANASTASMTEVTDAMTMSAQGFHALKVPIGDAATAIGIMANNGQKGGTAGAALNVALTKLAAPTARGAKLMKDMGVNVFDSNGKFIGLRGAIEQFTPKLDAMSEKQRLSTLAILGGTRGMRALNILLGGGVQQFDKMRTSVERSGQAQQLANAQTAGFSGALSALRSTIETLQIQVGLKLLPVLTDLVRWFTAELPAGVAVAGSAIDGVRGFINTMVADIRPHLDQIRQAFAGMGTAVSTVFGLISSNLGTTQQFEQALGAAVGVALALAVGIKMVTIAMAALDLVMDANPITLVVIAIAALVFAMVELYQRSETARNIMNAAWADIKAGAAAAMAYITGTVIPLAIAEWQKFGPQVKAAIQGAVSAVQQGMADIKAVVTTVLDFIKGHWNDIWSALGPIVKAVLQGIKTTIQTDLNVIGDVVRAFSDVLHGRWGAAWGELKHAVSDVLSGVVSIVGSILTGLATSAFAAAKIVGRGIGAGIKTAVKALEGLAGDLWGSVRDAINQVAGQALALATTIGSDIKDGAINGIKGLAGMIKAAAEKEIKAGLSNLNPFSPVSHGGEMFIGQPLAEGAVKGFNDNIGKLRDAIEGGLQQMAAKVATVTKANASEVGDAFKTWADNAKQKFDTGVEAIQTSLQAQLAKGQAAIAAMKAKLTPTELQIQIATAQAAAAKLTADVNVAWAAVNALKGQQEKAWADLLAEQKQNLDQMIAQQKQAMDQLKADAQQSTDSAVLAGVEFDRQQKTTGADPLAANLLDAQKKFDATKKLFDQGLVDQATFVAAANALDDAKLAASEDTNAQTLLDDYNTWQQALDAQATAGAAVTAQQAADAAANAAQQATDNQAQADLQATFLQQQSDAWTTYQAALKANGDAFLQGQADSERAARDTEAGELNTALVARYQRIKTHLDNVKTTTDRHYAHLEQMATTTGHNITENLANAMGDALDPNSTLTTNLKAIANLIKAYLKTNSPTELGPMADLDHWMDGFAKAYVKGLDSKLIVNRLSDAVNPKLNTSMMLGHYASDARVGATAMVSTGSQQNTFVFHETPADADPVAIGAVTSFALKNLRT